MVVRIRLGKGPKVAGSRRKNRHSALAVAALLPSAAFMAYILGLWSIAADLNWTGSFAIPSGIFSPGSCRWTCLGLSVNTSI